MRLKTFCPVSSVQAPTQTPGLSFGVNNAAWSGPLCLSFASRQYTAIVLPFTSVIVAPVWKPFSPRLPAMLSIIWPALLFAATVSGLHGVILPNDCVTAASAEANGHVASGGVKTIVAHIHKTPFIRC